jgi:hypothetical protein
MAGEAAAAAHDAPSPGAALAGYEHAVARELEPEVRAGAALLRLFERWPALVHVLLTRTGLGATAFVRFCHGTLPPSRVLRDPVAGRVLRAVAR